MKTSLKRNQGFEVKLKYTNLATKLKDQMSSYTVVLGRLWKSRVTGKTCHIRNSMDEYNVVYIH